MSPSLQCSVTDIHTVQFFFISQNISRISSKKHPLFDLALASECLNTIGGCILKETAYIDEEDERLIFAVVALLGKGMDENLLTEWIANLSNKVMDIKNTAGYSPYFFRMNTNVNQFIKSLYFRLLFLNTGMKTRQEIERILKSQVTV